MIIKINKDTERARSILKITKDGEEVLILFERILKNVKK